MSTNLGSLDRMIRLSLASTLLWIAVLGLAKGFWIIVPLSLAAMLIATCHHRRCPLYRFLGWSTLAHAPRPDRFASPFRAR